MEREQFENMSIDELWALYTDVDEILAARIVAKKQVLERRLAQLRQTVEPADSISARA
jgi:DNA-binding protein H-NS